MASILPSTSLSRWLSLSRHYLIPCWRCIQQENFRRTYHVYPSSATSNSPHKTFLSSSTTRTSPSPSSNNQITTRNSSNSSSPHSSKEQPTLALIFDTETSSKALFQHPPTHPSQPHLLQLAFLLLDTQTFRTRISGSFIVQLPPPPSPSRKPIIDPAAMAVHGITEDDCERFGVGSEAVLELFADVWRRAHVVVAHNLKFDLLVMEAALARSASSSSSSLEGRRVLSLGEKQTVCTMEESTDLCRIPGRFQNGEYKWPSLAEAYAYVTDGEELEGGGHDALVDARACLVIFRYLVEKNKVVVERPTQEEVDDDDGSTGDLPMYVCEDGLMGGKVNQLAESLGMVESPSSPTISPSSSRTEAISGFSVRGNTYEHRLTLRELGGRWSPTDREWVFKGEDSLEEVLILEGLVVEKKK